MKDNLQQKKDKNPYESNKNVDEASNTIKKITLLRL